MINQKRIWQAIVFLISPEDSSDLKDTYKSASTPLLSPSNSTWIGVVKAIFWSLMAIILSLVVASITS